MTIITKYTLGQYERAIELKNQGYGSQRISKILDLPNRGAIEGWINKGRKPYYFSEKRIEACNSRENVERMRAMNKLTQKKAMQISAELRTKRLPDAARNLSEELAYILGVVHGDGHVSVSQRRIILNATDEDFVLEFKKNLEKWSRFKARFFIRRLKLSKGIKSRKIQYFSYIDSKEASKFLASFDIKNILNSNGQIKRSFLRGLFDSEGSVAKDSGIHFYNTNKSLVDLVGKILISLAIGFTITISKTVGIGDYSGGKPYYTLNIYRKDSILNYYNLIGFTIERKQRRLIEQVTLINIRAEEDKMTEKTGVGARTEEHTVFIGSKPFMNPQ